jgi:hypothetical protein
VRKHAGFSHWSDQQRKSLLDVAQKAFVEKECHDATSLAWVLKDLTEGGVLVWNAKPARRKTWHTIAGDVLSHMERQGLLVRDGSGWYRQRQ